MTGYVGLFSIAWFAMTISMQARGGVSYRECAFDSGLLLSCPFIGIFALVIAPTLMIFFLIAKK